MDFLLLALSPFRSGGFPLVSNHSFPKLTKRRKSGEERSCTDYSVKTSHPKDCRKLAARAKAENPQTVTGE